MTAFKTLDDIGEITGKRVLVRVDLNVPMIDGAVSDATRLQAAVPTIRELSEKGAIVLLLAHFGRPKGAKNPTQSLSLVMGGLEDVLGHSVMFIPDCIGEGAKAGIAVLAPGDVAVLENTRFHAGEEKNDPAFADALAEIGDLYVNDAFSAAHRAHGSTEGIAGGAKVSTKIDVLRNLVGKVDHLIIGGGMANTFLAARGVDVGKSLCEHDLVDTANAIFDSADAAGCTIHLPYDVVVAQQFAPNPPTRTVNVHEVAADEMILDVGPAAVEALGDAIKNCRTLVWNGPLGAFETPPFDVATVALARTAAALTREGSLISVAGGGDTVAALNHADVAGDFTFVSTAGGAFLEWMEGKPLPGVEALLR